MTDYVFEYLDRREVHFATASEADAAASGILLWLEENGIPSDSRGNYYETSVCRLLKKIDVQDLKQYFLSYPSISLVHQICMELCTGKTLSARRKAELLDAAAILCADGLGEKYIPQEAFRSALGMWP